MQCLSFWVITVFQISVDLPIAYSQATGNSEANFASLPIFSRIFGSLDDRIPWQKSPMHVITNNSD